MTFDFSFRLRLVGDDWGFWLLHLLDRVVLVLQEMAADFEKWVDAVLDLSHSGVRRTGGGRTTQVLRKGTV